MDVTSQTTASINEMELAIESMQRTHSEMTILGIMLTLFSAFIIGGNCLVISAVGLVKKLRTPSNFLIVSLAISDMLVGVLVIPFASIQELLQNWPYGEAMCDLYISFDVLMCTASNLNLCVISIDRYLAITKPLQYAAKRTPKRMILMIVFVWISAALIGIPPMFGFKETFVPGRCDYSSNIIYQIYATCGAFYIPLLVMLIMYGRIFVLAKRMASADAKQIRVTQQTSNHSSSNQMLITPNAYSLPNPDVELPSPTQPTKPKLVKNSKLFSSIYPLPPSELCRRRKPRPLYSFSYSTNSQALIVPIVQTIPSDSNYSPLKLHAEKFEEHVEKMRKIRHEFFAAPYSRHSISIPLRSAHGELGETSTLTEPTLVTDYLKHTKSMKYSWEHSRTNTRSMIGRPSQLSIAPFCSHSSVYSNKYVSRTSTITSSENVNTTSSLQPVPVMRPIARPRQRPCHLTNHSNQFLVVSSSSNQRSYINHFRTSLTTSIPRRLSTPLNSLNQAKLRRKSREYFVEAQKSLSRHSSFASMMISTAKGRKKPIRSNGEGKAIKTLGIILGCFCLCWLPFFIIALVRPMYKVLTNNDLNIPNALVRLFLWLGYLNSALNPIIYGTFNREFRFPFKEILLCHCRDVNARLRSKRYVHDYGLTGSNLSAAMACQSLPNGPVNGTLNSRRNSRKRSNMLLASYSDQPTANRNTMYVPSKSIYN